MRLHILQVPDCPNVEVLEQRLHEALLGGQIELELTHRVVGDLAAAAAVGMTGSPTLLVDGADPFAEPGRPSSVSCRLYRGEDGRVEGAPSVAALRRALGVVTDDQAETEEACCAPSPDAPEPSTAWRNSRARTAPADPAERAAHRAILRAFATSGAPPAPQELERAAEPFRTSVEQVVGRLHAADVVRLGTDGRIQVAYPFSAVPTRHRVRLAGGTEVYAMCAIDALGMPAMLGVDVVITTADPTNGRPITVTVRNGRSLWDPATAVVFVGARPGGGPSAETCCDYLNVFTDRAAARSWTRAHPHVAGEIVDHEDAELLGRRIFGYLLTDREKTLEP